MQVPPPTPANSQPLQSPPPPWETEGQKVMKAVGQAQLEPNADTAT